MSQEAGSHMSNDPTTVEQEVIDLLAAVDVDGILHETAAAAFATTRRSFLRRSVGVAAGLAAFATATSARAAIASTQSDTAILQFDLALEYLQAGLYTEAERLGSLPGRALLGRTSARTSKRSRRYSVRGRPSPAPPSTTATSRQTSRPSSRRRSRSKI